MNKTLTEEQVKNFRAKSLSSLYFFAKAVLFFGDLVPHIHRPICEALQDYEKNTRLKVTFPRSWFKSTLCSVAYPLWRAIDNPNTRGLIVQNSYNNATKKLQAIKQIVENNMLFRALFPEILPTKKSRWAKDGLEFRRTAAHPECTIEAAGTGTATVARHYDFIIEDDTVVPDVDSMSGAMQQPTQLDIEKAIGWHKLSHPLLIHPSKSQIIIVGTRWAERDLLSWIDENAKNYLSISRAVRENDKGEPATPEDGGKAVWERYNDDVLDDLASSASIGPYMFACLYMNNPTDAVNQVFKREWIRYYKTPRKRLAICTSVDPAAADEEQAADPDYSVVMTTGVNVETGDIYILDYVRERLNPGELVDAIFGQVRVHKPLLVKVEAIAYQRTICYYLQERMKQLNIFFTIEEMRSMKGSKIDRIRGLQPYFSNGKICMKAKVMEDLERELLSFPRAAHDDLLDALSMQIDFWFHETETFRKEEIRDKGLDPFTGEGIIAELKRKRKVHRVFPNDLGIIADGLDLSSPSAMRWAS